MAALTLISLEPKGIGRNTMWESKQKTVSSGYKAFLIPDDVHIGVGIHVQVNTSANYNVSYLLDSAEDILAGTQATPIDVFGAAQTTSVDAKLSPLVRCVIVTFNSGTSIDIIVRAK